LQVQAICCTQSRRSRKTPTSLPVVSASILLVAQLSPPSTLVAARRVAGLTKYLARLGHPITVLTSAVSGEGTIDGADEVVRTPDLIATRLNWRRRHFAALGGHSAATYSRSSRLESVFVPDIAAFSWVPFALRRAQALQRREGFDCVITTSPPQSAHLVGAALRRRGVPWIAELRDGWSFEPPRAAWPFGVQQRADRALEDALLRRASAAVAVTAPIVEDLQARFSIPVGLITNGFDPEDEPTGEEVGGLLDPERFSLVHTGRMAIARSTPAPLLDALRLLRSTEPELDGRLEIVFAGPLSADEAELLAGQDVSDMVRTVGALERPLALQLQRAADALLVITEGSTRRSVATGKLFEYLAAKRPILVLGEETEAARIVVDAGAGFAASADDPEEIAAALKRLLDGDLSVPTGKALERYAYPKLAEEYSALIQRVVGGG
jgi:glycosyltransferase involved in cell wall biosynthesis